MSSWVHEYAKGERRKNVMRLLAEAVFVVFGIAVFWDIDSLGRAIFHNSFSGGWYCGIIVAWLGSMMLEARDTWRSRQ